MNRFQFVADHQRRFGVKRLCAIFNVVARSSFYYWRRTADDRAARQAADAKLAARIRTVRQDSNGTYGVPRIAVVAEVFAHLGFQGPLQHSPGDLRQQPALTEQGHP
ncbi:hypothetical protein ACFWBB_20390 [Streptomyces sp. NPDC060000]|uniref:hypothetical protein n=1 Tax=Streptomyces sp. NPDC060000 TaxID=3347031 RepID=UPI0036B4C411